MQRHINVHIQQKNMDAELREYLKRSEKIPITFMDKMKMKIKMASLNDAKVQVMQDVLLKEGKPIYAAFIGTGTPVKELVMQCYDERIKTLEKEWLYDLYNTFMELKNAKEKETKIWIMKEFIAHISIHYLSFNWFDRKIIAQNNPELIKSALLSNRLYPDIPL